MFANYLSRKNFSHTRANRRRNASPVGLPAAPVSITSQEAASHGLCGLPPGRLAFSMKEVCGYLGVRSSQLGETVPGEPSRSSCVPRSPLLSSLPFSSLLLCLLPSSPPISSLPCPSSFSFSLSLNQSVEDFCLTALLLPSQAHPRLCSQDHVSPARSPPYSFLFSFLLPNLALLDWEGGSSQTLSVILRHLQRSAFMHS